MQQHQQFFEDFLGKKADTFTALPQSGSSRINYIGSSGGQDYIITYNENRRENEAFFYFSELFSGLGLNTPHIFKINTEENLYIQEFLGRETLSEVIASEGLSHRVKILVKKSLEQLYVLQTTTSGKVDYSKSFEYERYDDLPVTHDLYYFKNFLVDILEIEYHKSTLLKEFRRIAAKVQSLEPKTLMIRDFQSRNILVNNNEVYFIDYQAAMYGPASYDVISFLYQAKANFPEDFRQEMLQYYVSFWNDKVDKDHLSEAFNWIKMMRFLQVLGAYGFRGLIQRKAHFITSLHQGIENIIDLSGHWPVIHNDFPELCRIIRRLKDKDISDRIKLLINQ